MTAVRSAASLWLLACPEDEALLQTIVDELARRRGGPVFRPHLTLMGDLARDAQDLAGLLGPIAAAAPPFAAPVGGVETTEAYFRALYAAFPVGPELAALRSAAAARTGGAAAGFVPHVSLFYGRPRDGTIDDETTELAQRLVGRPVRFDRLAAVASAQDIPIADWRIAATTRLGRGEAGPG
ncbi:MAG: 2'-5' RNA ligase family protein [Rhizobiales bacterium]|nr:2'-5' RNA ligase family protein [Hyphomicrobiales bacterium]